jgi:hypothetical protein
MNITDNGIINICRLERLKVLHVRAFKLTDVGMQGFENLQQLEKLTIERASITDYGISHLKRLRRLKEVHFRYSKETSKVTDEGLRRIRHELPNATISFE